MRNSVLVCAAVIGCAISSLAMAAPAGREPVVATRLGPVRGVQVNAVALFNGIPFAQPPIGDLRFAAPLPALAWRGTLDATQPRSPCPQVTRFGQTDASEQEDCLYLNIAVPNVAMGARASKQKLPVIVWLHGGAFVGGSGDIYPLDEFARQANVILVSINYRLGVFGFMTHPGFDARHNGSLGLEDQREALRWVKRNIAAFGGDVNNVTVAGESAGAASVCLQLIAPHESRGLFQKAIVQSIGCALRVPSVEVAQEVGLTVASLVHCDEPASALSCLRKASVRELLEASVQVSASTAGAFRPSVGSISVPQQPTDALVSGQFVRVPMINGGNRDEMRLYVGYEVAGGASITADNYVDRLKATYGDLASRVAASYPLSDYSSAAAAVGRAQSDFTPGNALNNCVFLDSARLMSRHTSVYEYEFTDADAPPVMENPGFEMGAVHSAELPYFYPHVSYNQRRNGADVVDSSQALSRQMMAYWGQFVRTGNPNGTGFPIWPLFKTATDVMGLDPKQVGPTDAAAAHQCGFWQALYPDAFRASAH